MKQTTSPSTETTLTPGLRRFLYLTAAITGGAILIVEILGAKLLSPFLGTSHFVWTAQITVTLISLALGYYLGGWWVDRSPRLAPLYLAILSASVYLCLTLPITETVAYACLEFPLSVGSVLASLFLFLVPLTLLAMTGPYLVRILARNMGTVGGQVGILSAVGTVGSVLGTLLASYLLIPFLPNSIGIYLTAGTLILLCGIFFSIWGKSHGKIHFIYGAFILFTLFGYLEIRHIKKDPFNGWQTLYKTNSNFGDMMVIDSKSLNMRLYLNDFLIQNTYDPTLKMSTSMFTYLLHQLPYVYTPKIESALCIGMGVGIAPMQLANDGVDVEVVEINPKAVDLAEKFFGFDQTKLKLIIQDGRYYLHKTPKKYDTVLLDAFLGDSAPSHLMTREAFQSIHNVLAPNGTLVINSFGKLEAGEDFLATSLYRTLKSVFKSVVCHFNGKSNFFYVASDQENLQPNSTPNWAAIHYKCRAQTQETFFSRPTIPDDKGIILTDDYNPVDYYDAKNRQTQRRLLALSIRDLTTSSSKEE